MRETACSGESLRDRLQRKKRLSSAELVALGSQLLEGLGRIHGAGLVHGDIKPLTIHVSGKGAKLTAMLVDGGITPSLWSAKGLGEKTALIGTPYYAPAEQFGGDAMIAQQPYEALRLPDGRGTLRPGAPADLVVWGAADYREIPYRFGTNLVLSHADVRRGREALGAVVRGDDDRYAWRSAHARAPRVGRWRRTASRYPQASRRSHSARSRAGSGAVPGR